MQNKMLRQTAANRKYSTPMYVFDTDELLERIDKIKEILPSNSEICYAIKANPFLTAMMDAKIEKYEVCSPGELHICKKMRIKGEKIVFSGVNKGKEDIAEAIEYGVGVLTAESEEHYQMISAYAANNKKNVKLILRLTNGSQFGMDEKILERMIEKRNENPFLQIEGIQFFSGTQKKQGKILEELEFLIAYCEKLKTEYAYCPQVLEYGPGLSVSYFEGDKTEAGFSDLQIMSKYIEEFGHGIDWVIEMGRYIAAACGYYITKVADTKRNHGKNYCIVDGGINHVNYYGQNMAMRVPEIEHIKTGTKEDAAPEEWSVCGSLCTFADVLVRKISFTGLKKGDILVFKNIGAYAVTEGLYLFLSRRMPEIYFHDSIKGMQLVRAGLETSEFNCENNIDKL